MLSMLAALQAPVIMMSQIRQDTKDRLARRARLRGQPPAPSGSTGAVAQAQRVIDKIDDLDEGIRQRLK